MWLVKGVVVLDFLLLLGKTLGFYFFRVFALRAQAFFNGRFVFDIAAKTKIGRVARLDIRAVRVRTVADIVNSRLGCTHQFGDLRISDFRVEFEHIGNGVRLITALGNGRIAGAFRA